MTTPGPQVVHKDGNHHWRFLGGNGEPLCSSETYTRAADAVRALRDFCKAFDVWCWDGYEYTESVPSLGDLTLTYTDVSTVDGQEQREQRPLYPTPFDESNQPEPVRHPGKVVE